MELAMATMGSLLPKLGVLLDKEYKLQNNVKRDFQYLQREFQSMHAALSEVAEVAPEQLRQHDRLWAGDVRELSQDIEDVVDSFLVRIEGSRSADDSAAQPGGCSLTTLFKLKKCKARHQIATSMKDIKDQVHELANRDGRYRGPHGAIADRVTATVDPLLQALYGAKKNIVGIDDAKDEIICKLCQGDHASKRQLRILSIVGFGGLGKTTLTKAVYDELRVQFECWAFVTVSRNPDVKKVLRDLFYELDNEKYKKLSVEVLFSERQLIEELRQSLNTKRYFVVIDDLWGIEAWETIRYALLDSNSGSRIITTTRNLEVSKACCSSNYNDIIYNMKHLSDNDSQILFYKRIFPSGTACPDELEQVSREILKKCGGVPLAIIAIASHLVGDDHQIKPKDQWDSLLNSIGRGITRGGGVEEMRRILSLSYYDLHYRLKTCLLYLSIFPEDTEISRDRLIRRWIAEGFFQDVNDRTNLFDLGESYFNMLINRSTIQPVDINAEGRAEACRVHDVMLDFICDLASEENFVTLLDVIKEDTPFKRKIRRMSLQKSTGKLITTRLAGTSMQQVRSLTIFGPASYEMPPLLSRFQVLRVLDLEGCRLRESCHFSFRSIGNLLHLRYLGLRGTLAHHKLPSEIGKLHFLRILDLGKTCAELPSSVVWLGHLVCLCLSLGIELPIGLRNLTSLEELTGLSMGSYCADHVKELGHLTNLRALDICWVGSKENKEDQALVESLCHLRKLRSLEIRGPGEHVYLSADWVPPPHLCRLVLRGWLPRLPAWFTSSSLPFLSYLHISVGEVWPEDIHILGMLPALRSICLRARVDLASKQCDGKRFVFSDGAFPCARQCDFVNVTMVPSNFPRGAMAMVQSLRFDFRVTDIVSGDFDLSMSSLPSLQDLYINYDMKKARRKDRVRAQRMLSRALKEHPNLPSLHLDYPWEEGGEGITAPGRGVSPSMASCCTQPLQVAGSNADGTGDGSADSIVQESSIPPPPASICFSGMLWPFIVETKLEMELILSTRIFWYLLIGSLLLYGAFCSGIRQLEKN